MAAPYSQDLRDRVLAAYDRGMKTKQIAIVFCVSPAWARRIKQRRRETGETTPRKMGSPGVRKIDRTRLLELVHADPDATLAELRDRPADLDGARNVGVSDLLSLLVNWGPCP